MTVDSVASLIVDMLKTALVVSIPMLLAGLITGVIISLFQTVTSIQEATMTFVPKMLAVGFAMIMFLPWVMNHIMYYTVHLWSSFSTIIGRY